MTTPWSFQSPLLETLRVQRKRAKRKARLLLLIRLIFALGIGVIGYVLMVMFLTF